ncbi:hypothetical protein ACIPF8_07610 [Collimonas sp. NPDC087041]|uniref:hypothetical protein n=1 Tax=Collimonas sp. NPDC087041 TaxID=3363960 RepID=UPI0037F72A7A
MSLDDFLTGTAANAIGSFLGAYGLFALLKGNGKLEEFLTKLQRPELRRERRRAPKDILFGIELGCPAGLVHELLGFHHRGGEKEFGANENDMSWAYRYSDALVYIRFNSTHSVKSIAIALTDGEDASFYFPDHMDLPPLGKINFADLSGEEGLVSFRSGLKACELFKTVNVLPQDLHIFYTFGALSPKFPGCLREVEFDWDAKREELRTPLKDVKINWMARSSSYEPEYFPWDLAFD